MRTHPEVKSLEGMIENSETAATSVAGVSGASASLAYNEMADVTVGLIDPVAEVEKNLAHLQELQARLRFMMREVRYTMKI